MRRAIFGLIIWAVICGLIFFPARWAAALMPASISSAISSGSVSGTIWHGQSHISLPRTQWQALITYKINPLDILIGRPFSKTGFNGPGVSGQGHLGFKKGKDITAEVDMRQLPISDPRLVGVLGEIFLTLDDIKIGRGCEQASGQVRSNVLAANEARWQWHGPVLSGPISCDGEAVLMALSGSDANIDVTLDLRLYTEGRYGVNMQITPKQSLPTAFGFVLSALGFEERPDGSAQLREQGQIFQGARR